MEVSSLGVYGISEYRTELVAVEKCFTNKVTEGRRCLLL